MIEIDEKSFEDSNCSQFKKLYISTMIDMKKQLLEKDTPNECFATPDLLYYELIECLKSFCSHQKINPFFIDWLLKYPCSSESFREQFIDKRKILTIFSDESEFVNYTDKLEELEYTFFAKLPLLLDESQDFTQEEIRDFSESFISFFFINPDTDRLEQKLIEFLLENSISLDDIEYDLTIVDEFISYFDYFESCS